MRARTRGVLLAGLFVLGALLAGGYLTRRGDAPRPRPIGTSPGRIARPATEGVCLRVIDGDTIELQDGGRVRLIGVNTPESVDPRRAVEHFGKEAAEFTRRMVEGKNVRLEYDEELQDQYGRTLAYVYLADGTFLNAEIIRQGFGFAYTRFPYRYQQEFVALEREARERRRGMWGE